MKNISVFIPVLGLLVFSALSGPATGEETEFKPHFILRILGGPSCQSLDDLNGGSQGLSGFSAAAGFIFRF
jgi:hypothetical protein